MNQFIGINVDIEQVIPDVEHTTQKWSICTGNTWTLNAFQYLYLQTIYYYTCTCNTNTIFVEYFGNVSRIKQVCSNSWAYNDSWSLKDRYNLSLRTSNTSFTIMIICGCLVTCYTKATCYISCTLVTFSTSLYKSGSTFINAWCQWISPTWGY